MGKLSFKIFIFAAILVISFDAELKVVEGRALVTSNQSGTMARECKKDTDCKCEHPWQTGYCVDGTCICMNPPPNKE
nr:hypothetical protein [Tanacetum cinerariifolium]